MKTVGDEKIIKQLKDTIEILKKEITKLKTENKTILNLKQSINKLQEEKMDIARKLMELESESILYKGGDDPNDEMLYNPKISSLKKNLSKNSNFSMISLKKRNTSSIVYTTNFSFSINSNSNINIKEILNNKNEEISLLKSELIKKEQIINEFKKNRGTHDNSILGFTEKKANPYISFSKQIKEDFINKKEDFNSLCSSNRNSKLVNDSIFEENDVLEKNIYNEIQNILEEKRNFILNTLTYENFSFDILQGSQNANDGKISNNIEQILEIIKKRKKKVEMEKKQLEQKFI